MASRYSLPAASRNPAEIGAFALQETEIQMAQTRNPMSVETLGAFIREKVTADNVPGLSVARRRR
jgi:hypothetical protein